MTRAIAARRPHELTPDECDELVRAAQAEFLRTEAAHNLAISERAKAALLAYNRGGRSWTEIGQLLGGIDRRSASALVARYLDAVAEGRAFGMPGPERDESQPREENRG